MKLTHSQAAIMAVVFLILCCVMTISLFQTLRDGEFKRNRIGRGNHPIVSWAHEPRKFLFNILAVGLLDLLTFAGFIILVKWYL